MSAEQDRREKYVDRQRGLLGAVVLASAIGLSYVPWEAPDSIYAPIAPYITPALFWMGVVGALLLAWSIGHTMWRHSRPGIRRRLYHAPGWAGRHDFADSLGAGALTKDGLGRQVRPSLATRAQRAGYKPRALDYGVLLGRALTGPRVVRRRKVYSSWENSVLLYGPPGAGKTALLIHWVLGAPGAVLSATTKLDVWAYTHRLREQHGPTALFNPSNVGGQPSTFFFDVMIGCEHYAMAQSRARALVEGTKAITEIQERSWAEKCVDILAKLILAARLEGGDMRTVAFWLANPDRDDPLVILRSEQHAAHVPPGWANSLQAEMHSSADRMKGSIWSLARSAVAFMGNPVVSAAVTGHHGQNFDIESFIRSNGTLYLVGDDKDDTIGPLLNALTQYVYYGAKALADERKVRLDPPMAIILDEVTQITPVPLPEWTAVARGAGIWLGCATQTPSQVRIRWGRDGASTLKTTVGTKVILGGIQEPDDLEEFSLLVGDREVPVVSEGQTRSGTGSSESKQVSYRKERIIPPSEVRKLAKQHALVLARSANAVVVKYQRGQQRAQKEIKKLEKKLAAAAARQQQTSPVTASSAGERQQV